MKRRRIGLVASLDTRGSVHSRTFQRSVALARVHVGEAVAGDLEFVVRHDGANAEGGRRAAEELCAGAVDCVVGHYASASALAAAPVYAAHSVPLLLPAATSDALTRGLSNTYRVCNPDHRLVASLLDLLAPDARLWLGHDDGPHGVAVTDAIRQSWAEGGRALTSTPREADAAVYAGSFDASVAAVAALRDGGFRASIHLTDDAVHPDLPARLPSRGLGCWAIGFAPPSSWPGAAELRRVHRERWGIEPGVYFVETIAAIEIAARACAESLSGSPSERLATDVFRTVVGDVRFTSGESFAGRYALFSAADELRVVRHSPFRRTALPFEVEVA